MMNHDKDDYDVGLSVDSSFELFDSSNALFSKTGEEKGNGDGRTEQANGSKLKSGVEPSTPTAASTSSVNATGHDPSAFKLDLNTLLKKERANWRLIKEYFERSFELIEDGHDFFDRLDQSGLPVIAIVGTHQSGKTTLLNSMVGDSENLSVDDRLKDLTRLWKGQIKNGTVAWTFSEPLCLESSYVGRVRKEVRKPLICPALRGDEDYVRLPQDQNPPFDEMMKWLKQTGGVLRSAQLIGLYPDIRDPILYSALLSESGGLPKTTKYFTAHFVHIGERPLILLDVPGESADRATDQSLIAETKHTSIGTTHTHDLLRQRLPHVATSVVLVEPFDHLWSSDIEDRIQIELEADTKPSLKEYTKCHLERDKDGNHTRFNASEWKPILNQVRKLSIAHPISFLAVITKFDQLAIKTHSYRLSSNDTSTQQTLDTWNEVMKQLCEVWDSTPNHADALVTLGDKMKKLLQVSETIFSKKVGKENYETRLWNLITESGLGQSVDGERYETHRLLEVLPVCCLLPPESKGQPIGSVGQPSPQRHGVSLLLLWILVQAETFARFGG